MTNNERRRLGPGAATELGKLSENIKTARKRRKITRAEMAKRTRVSPATIARLESKDPSVSIGTVLQVLSILGLSSGLAEVVAPENDVAQTVKEIRDLRLKKRSKSYKQFTDEELNF